MNALENCKVYGVDSLLEGVSGYEGKTVREVIQKTKNKTIWKLIKRGYQFEDEVLSLCNISKSVRDVNGYCEIVEHSKVSEPKVLKKDTASYEDIIESLSTVEVEDDETEEEENIIDEEENEEDYNSDNNE